MKTLPKKSEHQLQSECVKIFHYKYPALQWSFIAIPNGGQRNIIVASKLKKEGVLSGCWDLLLLEPRKGYAGLFLEAKVGRNKLTDNQIAFRDANKEKYAFEVFYTTEQFLTAVTNYLL